MDLSNLDLRKFADDGAECALVNPLDGKKLDSIIRVQGADSTEFKKAVREKSRMVVSGKEVDDDEFGIELLASITIGWENIELDGKQFPFSKENAVTLYKRFDWVKDQVNAFAGRRANFIKS